MTASLAPTPQLHSAMAGPLPREASKRLVLTGGEIRTFGGELVIVS